MPNTKNSSIITDNLNVVVFGHVGSGKSVFAASFPTPAFLFDFDKQATTAYRDKSFDYLQYPMDSVGWNKFKQDFTKLMSGHILNDKDEWVLNTNPELRYKTVVIDSITAMSDLAMRAALTLNPGRSESGGPVWNIHYGHVKHMVGEIILNLISYQGYKVILGHLTLEKNSDGQVIEIRPMLTGALAERIPGYCGEVLIAKRAVVGNPPKEQFVLQTVSRGLYTARSGLSGVEGYLDPFMPNNFTAIVEMVKERRSNALK